MAEENQTRILIADDREENRYVLRRILSRAGYNCVEAGTGASAIEISQTLPNIVILDVRLPDMSGYDVCRTIKADPRTAAIPVLQISASFVSPEDRARALKAGADGYLTHPIDGVVLVATVRALLRLRTAEAAARKAADQWQATFDALSEGLALLDAEGHVVRWNGAFARICGHHFDSNENLTALLQRLIGKIDPFDHPVNSEIELDGRAIHLSINPVGAGNAESGTIVVLADISDRKLAEYAIRTAEKLAATGKLASAIAHEINNPLEALTNLIYLAQASTSVDTIQGLLAHATAQLERITRVTKQTLTFHRDTQQPVEVDISELLAEAVVLFERIASARRVRLKFENRPVQPICGFPGQLSQVFGNLIRNAAEAAPAGTEVSIRVRSIQRGGRDGLRVTIHDRGCGIPENVKGKIFDPFFTTKDLKGSGLGLWVSKSLVMKHGGTIRFRSSTLNPSGGTTFEVYLPLDGLASQNRVEMGLDEVVAPPIER